ncbi:MAG: glycogen debranching enzyme N-terminal domain-containing protein [Verrucomicrobia bacterium]|nr:glycogen debranching enzyme N-terminal domain-containing protein [Verrucomicrobiota bacterium]
MQRLVMEPSPGERVLRFVGDRLRFALRPGAGGALPAGWRARLRTNLGRAAVVREEIIHSRFQRVPLAGASWWDVRMEPAGEQWRVELGLTEVGYFKAKPYAIDAAGRQHWPDGPDIGITVQPDWCRTANTIYCAFARLFGDTRSLVTARDARLEHQFKPLDQQGYTVIPPSGKLRDVVRQLPHIFGTLGCRILQLLPITPTPTTYARMGRFGSPYALQDLTAIDPALVEFDRRTTGVEQFCELAYAVHERGGRLFLDLAINHTGWGSTLHECHSEWFARRPDGTFLSPGAWGVTWEDLVELDQRWPELWEHFAEAFRTWCRRGVDGFRCDAGYKIPAPAWQHIIARVRQEFPGTVFLLEGLGGSWEASEALLTEGGMQWAYSELFQNYSGQSVASYLDHCHRQCRRVGVLVHFSETHDNDRLAARGRAWSLLRNRLCALTSVSGGFGFTCGVEWLASEKILVHQVAGLAWDAAENLVPELGRLNRLLAEHPCFIDGATLTRLSAGDAPVYALLRTSAEGADTVLVLVNTDMEQPQTAVLTEERLGEVGADAVDLLGSPPPKRRRAGDGKVVFEMPAGAAFCLSATTEPRGIGGERYRQTRAQAAWALCAVAQVFPLEAIGPYDWRRLAERVGEAPERFLAATLHLERGRASQDLGAALDAAERAELYPPLVTWRLPDRRRVVLVPPGHWLLVRDTGPFRATLEGGADDRPRHAVSIPVREGHVACFLAPLRAADARLVLERYADAERTVAGAIRFLGADPEQGVRHPIAGLVLLTNGRGGMARIHADLGRVESKYDCVLGANLHPSVPVDRHIFVKSVRAWVNADGFITPLDAENLLVLEPGPPAVWRFTANAGDGRAVNLELTIDMLEGRNTTVLQFHRPSQPPPVGRHLPPECEVSLTVRLDLEDRNFHTETHRNGGAEHHFTTYCRALMDRPGFEFIPAPDRRLRAFADAGYYHHESEWREQVAHPVEASRGQVAAGDAFSPGWFELPLGMGRTVRLVLTADAETERPSAAEIEGFAGARAADREAVWQGAGVAEADAFGRQLVAAARQFVVRRGTGKTVIAGYPWFLDWGRDALICARGLLAAGLIEEVRQLLVRFGALVDGGTLPNAIYGENTANRDTVDAPLWYGLACEDTADRAGEGFYATRVDGAGRTIADTLRQIGRGFRDGTPNGIRMDAASGLVWSPAHFTWMDTNYPAGTPREGYAVEIQALWIRLLRQLARLEREPQKAVWEGLARRAEASLASLFWLEDRGYLADVLLAGPGRPAAEATRDTALRSNGLLAVSLGLIGGERARRCVEVALNHLLVPGALRSLAPLAVTPPLPIRGHDGRLLNNPGEPYWGRYEGDEDTRRKPAYHNGTAWTWTLPTFCEALAVAWDFSPPAVAAARAYLGSMGRLLTEGCLGQIPEILDGDAPHQARGCDAQAWGVSEALRVWRALKARS